MRRPERTGGRSGAGGAGSTGGGISWFFVSAARGLAAFLAAYTALSLAALALGNPHNQNAWWIDLSLLPSPVQMLMQLALVIVLAAFALRIPRRRASRIAGAAVCLLFAAFAVMNSLAVYDAARAGLVTLGFPLPFSIFIALAFLLLALAVFFAHRTPSKSSKPAQRPQGAAAGSPRRGGRLKTVLVMALTVVLLGIVFPLGQILCFGTTDYRDKVDAAVVLGAQVLPNGTPSYSLQERLDTAIGLYNQGLAPMLIMSGGIDVEGTNEAKAMKDYAVSRGVPESAILLDEYGNNTEASAKNTGRMFGEQGFERVAVVSSFYHMARIKMTYLVNGYDVLTVPAPIDTTNNSLAFSTLREVPGWWYYWFSGIIPD